MILAWCKVQLRCNKQVGLKWPSWSSMTNLVRVGRNSRYPPLQSHALQTIPAYQTSLILTVVRIHVQFLNIFEISSEVNKYMMSLCISRKIMLWIIDIKYEGEYKFKVYSRPVQKKKLSLCKWFKSYIQVNWAWI